MGVEPYNFVSALNCILAQRLVRVICEACKKEVYYPPEVLEASGLDPQVWGSVPFYEGEGCIECGGTGFRGRTAIHELLDLTDRIREMILDKRPTSEIRRAAREEGMRFLRESALDKVKAGHHHPEGDQQGHLHRDDEVMKGSRFKFHVSRKKHGWFFAIGLIEWFLEERVSEGRGLSRAVIGVFLTCHPEQARTEPSEASARRGICSGGAI